MTQKENGKTRQNPEDQDRISFKGYTIEELRYQRALTALRKEHAKEKLEATLNRLNPRSRRDEPKGMSGKALMLAGNVASKVFSNLTVLDYVLMGFSAFGTVRKGIKFFKRK